MSEVEAAARKAAEAGEQIKRSLDVKAEPSVGTAGMEEATRKAQETGDQIKQSLEVKAEPSVGTAGLEKALGLARQLRRELEGLGRMGVNIRYGGPGSHVLHDGAEAH